MKKSILWTGLLSACAVSSAGSAELSLASSDIGGALNLLRGQLDVFEAGTGHKVELVEMPNSSTDQLAQYKVWLSAGSNEVDLLLTDVVWAPQLAEHFEDVSALIEGQEDLFLPQALESQSVDGRLVALPLFTSAPALFYRTDLLEKYGAEVPQTWNELTSTSRLIMEGERSDGKAEFWGYVFQGSSYEGLTCNALEWIISSGGGTVVAEDGSINLNIDAAVASLDLATSWVGTISPEGVLSYQEEEARGVWQLGNAAFMRNWPYAETLGQFDDSAVKGLFSIAPLPHGDGGQSTPTLGGFNIAVSKYSDEVEAAKELAAFLIQEENQAERLELSGDLPTLLSLYNDDDTLAARPSLGQWLPILQSAKPRPSAAFGADYNEASAAIWNAAHNALGAPGSVADQLDKLELTLTDLVQ